MQGSARRDAMINEPVIHDEPELTAETEAEPSWQPGDEAVPDGPADGTPPPSAEAEPEIEI